MHANGTTILRPAHTSEAAAMATMSRLHIEYGLRWRWTPARVRSSIRDRETMVLVASVDGDVAGFAIMRFGDTEAHLHLLAVSPAHRRLGLGRALLDWLEVSCRTAGIQRIRVELREHNGAAREFYSSLGFRRIGRIPGYYDRQEAALVLSKRLTVG